MWNHERRTADYGKAGRVNLDRRIANAVKRLQVFIDGQASLNVYLIQMQAEEEQKKMHDRFNTAARSLGQQRRWRNHVGT